MVFVTSFLVSTFVFAWPRTALGSCDNSLHDYWDKKPKYYILVGVDKYGSECNCDLPYIENDIKRFRDLMNRQKYEKLAELIGPDVRQDKFVDALEAAKNLPDDAILIVYFSGHGELDPKRNLWLQLHGQNQLGAFKGISISTIVDAVRSTNYNGQLAIIIDSCHSGAAQKTELIGDTSIFMSTGSSKESHRILLDDKTQMSAFTYLITRGLKEDWSQVDTPGLDGAIVFGELKSYVAKNLKRLFDEKKIPGEMEPREFTSASEMIVAISEDMQQRNGGMATQFKIECTLNPSTVRSEFFVDSSLKPVAIDPQQRSNEALELAKTIPDTAGVFTRALKAIAEKRFIDAKKLLDQAEAFKEVDLYRIYRARARASYFAGQPKVALDWYRRIDKLRWSTKNPIVLSETAYVLQQNSSYVDAERYYQFALSLFDTKSEVSVDTKFNYASLLMQTGRTTEAERLTRESIIERMTLETKQMENKANRERP